MANTSRVNGFRPVKHLNGSPWNGQVTMYSIDATDATVIAVGDMVKTDGSAATEGIRQVTRATVSAAVCGAVVGFVIDPTALNTPQYRTALTQRYVFVADSPDVIFECQANQTCTATIVGLNCDLTIAAASTITGASGMQADISTTNTTATIVLKIVEVVQRPDNAIGTSNKILVRINNHQFNSGTGTLGV